MLPKQRLAGPCGGKLPLSNMATQSNRAWISPVFMTPGTHFNLVTQLPDFLSPAAHLSLSVYLLFTFHFHLTWSAASSIRFTSMFTINSLTVTLASLLSLSPLHHQDSSSLKSYYYLFVYWPISISLSSLDLFLYWQWNSTGLHLTPLHLSCLSPPARCGGLGLHDAVNPAASACLTPATSLTGQPEVAHTDTHNREQTPDVAMTNPMAKSWGIKAIKLGKPLDCCNVMMRKVWLIVNVGVFFKQIC